MQWLGLWEAVIRLYYCELRVFGILCYKGGIISSVYCRRQFMKFLWLLSSVFMLAGCETEPPVEPTDGPCGPGAWIITTGPDGIVCTPNGW